MSDVTDTHEKPEDLEIGLALRKINIIPEDVKGPDDLEAFLPFTVRIDHVI